MNQRPKTAPGGRRTSAAAVHRSVARPAPDRVRAIARAIASIPHNGTGARRWSYADAARTGDHWTCVLGDGQFMYIVRVHARTGQVILAHMTMLPAGASTPTSAIRDIAGTVPDAAGRWAPPRSRHRRNTRT